MQNLHQVAERARARGEVAARRRRPLPSSALRPPLPPSPSCRRGRPRRRHRPRRRGPPAVASPDPGQKVSKGTSMKCVCRIFRMFNPPMSTIHATSLVKYRRHISRTPWRPGRASRADPAVRRDSAGGGGRRGERRGIRNGPRGRQDDGGDLEGTGT